MLPPSGCSSTHDHLEQCRLADAVGADDAHDPVPRQRERQVVHEQPVAVPLGQADRLDHHVAQARSWRDLDVLEVKLAGFLCLGGHLLVALQPGALLGLARSGVGPNPVQLVLQPLGPLGVLGALDPQPGLLGLQVGRVVALVRIGPAPVELEDPLRDVVEEVPVVGDGHHTPRVLLQVLLEPLHALGVQVVGRLVEEEQVRLLQQQFAQGHPPALAAGQDTDISVTRWAPQRVHRLLELRVQIPGLAVVELLLQPAHLVEKFVGVVHRHLLGDLVEPLQHRLGLGNAFLDVAEHGLVLVESRLLLEDAHRVAGAEGRVAVRRLVEPGHDPQHGGLAGAIRTDDADLRSRQEMQRDVIEDDLVAVRLAHLAHREDELRHSADQPTWSC